MFAEKGESATLSKKEELNKVLRDINFREALHKLAAGGQRVSEELIERWTRKYK